MKVAVSATGNTLDALVHRQFGRCDWFVIFEHAQETTKTIENPYAGAETGAGIGCAQDLIEKGVDVVISGQLGPKAYDVFKEAGVEIYLAPPGISVQSAYEKFLSKELTKMEIKVF